MEFEKLNIINSDGDCFAKISETLKTAVNKFSEDGFLIANRKGGTFFNTFANSMFEYNSGVLMLERFYKKEKCSKENKMCKTFSDEDKKLMKEFSEFTKSIPTASELSKNEREKYTDRIGDYRIKISAIKEDVAVIETYMYKNILLLELSDLEKSEMIEGLIGTYTAFCFSFFSAMSWSNLEDVSVAISVIENEDYIDLIIFPIRKEDEADS